MAEPRHANVEFANGEWKVWRTFKSLSAAMAGVSRLCEVEASAYDDIAVTPVVVVDVVVDESPSGLVDERTAAAYAEYEKRARSGCPNGACEVEEIDE